MRESGEMEDTVRQEGGEWERERERRRDWDVPSSTQNRGSQLFDYILCLGA